jgi:hypothetical protein
MEKKEYMRINNNPAKVVMLAMALVLTSFTLSFAQPHPEYKFKVHNNTKQNIKKIEVSEDGKTWGEFDIGSGIKAGATDTLVWDKSTDNGNCEQYFRATFADGERSDAVKFDFCEKDLVLEFN